MTRWPLAITLLAACGQPPPPQQPPQHSVSTPDAQVIDAPIVDGTRTLLPGCTQRESEARLRELEDISARVQGATADARLIVDELRLFVDKPCMRHVRPAIAFPTEPTIAQLRLAFAWGFDSALIEAAGGLEQKHGHAVQVLPPSLVPDLGAQEKAAIAALRCTATDGSCGPAASYVMRAEGAFDARYAIEIASHQSRSDDSYSIHLEIPARACAEWLSRDPDAPRPKTYEAWVSCMTSRVPRNTRFAVRDLRAPTKGWLVLRGHRGHYAVADEIRAYDLATGAAYVASNFQGLVSPGTPTGMSAFTGRVDPGQLREVAFMLRARPALVRVRTRIFYAEIPESLSLALSKDGAFPGEEEWGRVVMRSSDETTIHALLRDGNDRYEGTFTWPESFWWPDTHLVDLVEIMEAGLVRGCAPAKLPHRKQLEIPATTDPALVRAFDGLRTATCKGVR